MLEKKEERKEVVTEKIVSFSCDVPGCNHKEYHGSRGIWNEGNDGDFETTDVSANLIVNGSYVKYKFDVCPACFHGKIVPLLEGEEVVENKIGLIKDKIRRLMGDMSAQEQRAADKAKEASSLSEQTKHLEEAIKCRAVGRGYQDILEIINGMA